MATRPASGLDALLTRVRAATGRDPALDAAIHRALAQQAEEDDSPTYSSSVDDCLALIHRALPDWAWHVGFGPTGIVPYAALMRGEQRFEASAPTVPLALLAATLTALMSLDS